jgi:uncharacterized NAD-dependent epimerase/dehydratase family protein
MSEQTLALSPIVELRAPYLLFLGNERSAANAKTAFGVRDWRPDRCLAQWRLSEDTVSLGLRDLNPTQAVQSGAQSLLIGVAPFGGQIDPAWVEPIVQALNAGLDIVSGMHTPLESVDALRIAAAQSGRRLVNVRLPRGQFQIADGRKRKGKRLLTVGTDCALGKKYTALAITKAITDGGGTATFRATGQTGIMISGAGIAIDAVVSDFVAGAAEALSPDNHEKHWDVIEGQGSLLHPAYAGVSLGLMHGSQPDAIILCHDTRRTHIDGFPSYVIPPLRDVIELTLSLAKRTNPNVRCVGISLNTFGMKDDERASVLRTTERANHLTTFDPMTKGLAVAISQMGLL